MNFSRADVVLILECLHFFEQIVLKSPVDHEKKKRLYVLIGRFKQQYEKVLVSDFKKEDGNVSDSF